MTEETPELTDEIITEAATVIAYACWVKDMPLKLTVTDLKANDIVIGDYIISVKKNER